MYKMFHGTSRQCALEIEAKGFDEKSYITSEFELATSYALRQRGNAVILVFEIVDFEPPEEPAFDVEFLTTSKAFPIKKLAPTFDSNELPEDYYDLDEEANGRKYPQFFEEKAWAAL